MNSYLEMICQTLKFASSTQVASSMAATSFKCLGSVLGLLVLVGFRLWLLAEAVGHVHISSFLESGI